jgi:hypothetical protein
LAVIAGLALLGFLVWFVLGFLFGPQDPESGKGSWVPSSFFPVSTPATRAPGDSDETGDPTARRTVPILRQLSDVPTAGMVAYDREQGDAGFRTESTVFRWIERGTGHIYETTDDDITKTRVSNTTIPGIQEAFFADDGSSVVARYLREDNETIETVIGQIESVTETTNSGYVYNETKLVTRYLEPNLSAAGDAPATSTFFALAPRGEGSAVLFGRYATGTPGEAYRSDLSDWVVTFVGSALGLQTKAKTDALGYLFTVGQDGQLEKVIDGHTGLTVSVNPAGTRALFSETVDNDLRTWSKNLLTGEERLLELRTLPEKCAWSPTAEATIYCGAPDFYVRGAYPTNWYQGRFAFDDNIWKFDVDLENYEILYDTRTADQTFDVWKPLVSPDGDHFLFLNKRDLTLWSLEVAGR